MPASERPLIPGSTYDDQYLASEELPVLAEVESAPASAGLRSLSAEYRGESLGSDSATVHGLSATATRETLDYGGWRVAGTVVQQDAAASPQYDASDGDTAGTFLVSQEGFALTRSWTLAQSAGDQPLRAPSLVSASSRVQLPSSLMRGYVVGASDGRQHLSAQVGRSGRYGGVYVQSFEPQEARVTTLDWQRALTREWDLALHAGGLAGHDAIADHQSLAAAARWHPPRAFEFRANVLANDDGTWGAWSEAESVLGGWRHRYGLFHLEPRLAWNDVSLSSDRSGAHWRADFAGLRHALGGGLDVEEANVSGDPARPGRRLLSASVAGSRQLRAGTRLGVIVNGGRASAGRGLPSEDVRSTGIMASLNQRFAVGVSNLQLALSRAEGSPSQDLDTTRVLWDHEWLPLYGTRVATTLGSERLKAGTYTDQRLIAGVSLRRDLLDQLRLSADVSTDRSDRDAAQVVRAESWTGTATAQWAFAPSWEAGLQAAHTRVAAEGAAAGNALTDDRALLTLRWSSSSGSPYELLGRPTGAPGSGRISGTVFRDTNDDGVRNPGEAAEAGLLVYLDGRIARQTDPQGRFEFGPVHAGAHTVSIAVEDVPLPFGLADHAPMTATVVPRGEVVIDIPLVRVDEMQLPPGH